MLRKRQVAKTHRQSLPVGTVVLLVLAANIIVLFALLRLPWLQKAFLIASPFCPQRPTHSVFIGGQQMPIEARMFGMFGGALLAGQYFAWRRQLSAAAMPRGWRLALCIALFAVMALDGTNALLYDTGVLRLYAPNLILRLGTGLASGVGIAMVLVPLANQTLFLQPHKSESLFTGWKDVAGLAAVQVLLFAFTLADWPPALLPLSLFNSAAVMFIMTVLATLVLVLLTGRAGRFVSPRATLGHVTGGFVIAAVFIAILALMRFALFGAGPIG